MYDGLGSVRQLVDGTGSVGLAQTFDPYGSGYAKAGSVETALGYTGEQTDGNGFVYLRARYYAPGMGRFFQRDTWRGDNQRPQSLNGYMYSEGNPIRFTDPTGHYICPEFLPWCKPKADLPSADEWYRATTNFNPDTQPFYGTYYPESLRFLRQYRAHIIAAARRHFQLPQDLRASKRIHITLIYTLATILYREHNGWIMTDAYRVFGDSKIVGDTIQPHIPWLTPNCFHDVAAVFGLGDDPSLGAAQIRISTAKELEDGGFVFVPLIPYTKVPVIDRVPFSSAMGNWQRALRLLNPIWAIEYAAANMDQAHHRTDSLGQTLFPADKQLTYDDLTRRYAAWHTAGIFDASVLTDEYIRNQNPYSQERQKEQQELRERVNSYSNNAVGIRNALMAFDWLCVYNSC